MCAHRLVRVHYANVRIHFVAVRRIVVRTRDVQSVNVFPTVRIASVKREIYACATRGVTVVAVLV